MVMRYGRYCWGVLGTILVVVYRPSTSLITTWFSCNHYGSSLSTRTGSSLLDHRYQDSLVGTPFLIYIRSNRTIETLTPLGS